MKKFKLTLDELKIDSFETAKTTSEKGTVKGFITTPSVDAPCISLGDPTCLYTCLLDDACLSRNLTCDEYCIPTGIC